MIAPDPSRCGQVQPARAGKRYSAAGNSRNQLADPSAELYRQLGTFIETLVLTRSHDTMLTLSTWPGRETYF